MTQDNNIIISSSSSEHRGVSSHVRKHLIRTYGCHRTGVAGSHQVDTEAHVHPCYRTIGRWWRSRRRIVGCSGDATSPKRKRKQRHSPMQQIGRSDDGELHGGDDDDGIEWRCSEEEKVE